MATGPSVACRATGADLCPSHTIRRLQVLFGMLLRGDRAAAAGGGGGAAPGSAGMPADSNILRMAPVGPRFSYLPVTTPVALLRQSSQLHPLHHASSTAAADLARAAPALSLGLGGGAGAAGSEVSATAFTFANLLSGSAKAGRAAGEEGGEAAGTGAASSAVGVASKLVGLLGDQLGDMSAAQGLLSSLGARFNK